MDGLFAPCNTFVNSSPETIDFQHRRDLWELVRRVARTAGIEAWGQLSPHSLRHSAITFALDAGATLRDGPDYAVC